MSHRKNWTTTDHVEAIAHSGGYPIEVGTDADGDYSVVITREGVEYAARLRAVSA